MADYKECFDQTLVSEIKPNSAKAWLLAARPKTLSGAMLPVVIGIMLAINEYGWYNIRIIPMILCALFACVMQIDANFINDYFDFLKGNDASESRLGPKRACTEGWVLPKAMKIGIFVTTLIGGMVGLPLLYYGGLKMIFIGIICVVFCFLYTTKLSYIAMGDLLVLVFFGIIPCSITYYLILPNESSIIPFNVFMVSIACGMVVDTLLIVNNYRDRDNDKQAHKITLVVLIGEKNAELLYLLVGYLAILIMWFVLASMQSVNTLAAQSLYLVYALMHTNAYFKMKKIYKGRELNRILALSSFNIILFGTITTIVMIIL